MNPYEELLEEAREEGLIVKEKDLQSCDGRIKGKKIAIRKDIETTAEKADTLAEELGHHYTTVGDIRDQSQADNRKQELHARMWGYNRRIGLQGLINAYEHGCSSKYEIAEYLRVTEQELTDCIKAYRNKFGVCTEYNGYIIYFIPHLAIANTNNFNCEFANELIILNLFDLGADRKLSAV